VVRDGRRAEEDTLPASRKGGIGIGAQPCEWNAVRGAGGFGWDAERLPGRVETVGKSIAWMRGSVGEGNERRDAEKQHSRILFASVAVVRFWAHRTLFWTASGRTFKLLSCMFSILHNITQVGPHVSL
jgi:hypothetical protein